MTVKELIQMLRNLDEEQATVEIWDPDADDFVPVTGCVYSEKIVVLQSDDNS